MQAIKNICDSLFTHRVDRDSKTKLQIITNTELKYDQIHKIVTWRVAMNEKRLRIRRHCVHCTIDDRAETSSIPAGRRTENRGRSRAINRIDPKTVPHAHRKSQSNSGIVHGHCQRPRVLPPPKTTATPSCYSTIDWQSTWYSDTASSRIISIISSVF